MKIGLIDLDYNGKFPNIPLMKLSELGYWAYVMTYDKEHCTDQFYKDLARWVNNRFIFAVCKTFEEYIKYKNKKVK